MSSRWATTGLVLGLLLGCGQAAAAADATGGDGGTFRGDAAFAWLERQVALGPRVPGTAANTALRDLIVATARENGHGATQVCLDVVDPLGGEEIEICNVVVRVRGTGPDTAAPWWLGAHFDTRPIADHDPDPARRGLPVPGANDGASGTAVLLHLMEVLAATPPPQDVLLLFFDGEDSGTAGDPGGFCLGSRHLAATWDDFGSPLAGPAPQGLILLDMVGEKGARVPQEAYSRGYATDLTAHVFGRAAELGLEMFVAEPGPPVFDDHVPFLQAGIPAIDLIDFGYPEWHTTADLPAACSAASLGQAGTLVLDLVRRP
ncbi:M28 family peptidase [bacterium]|nr:M28 family peptidase [bacterium]